MAKRNSQTDVSASLGEMTLSKPQFDEALAFAESGVSTFVAADIAIPPLHRESEVSQRVQTAWSLMPTDALSRKILQERAQLLATVANEQKHEVSDQFLCFRLGSIERYGIPYAHLQELLYVGSLAPVPCTPAFIAGVVNHRGELLTVLDLKHFFRIAATPRTGEARIVVIQHGGMRAGLLVDGVDGNENFRTADLAPPLNSEGVFNMEHVLGIQGGNVTMLNVPGLLSDPALTVGRTA